MSRGRVGDAGLAIGLQQHRGHQAGLSSAAQGAPYTGTSLNPARSLAPALLAPDVANVWVYVAGPCAGALLAAAIFAAFRDTNTLTAKLSHDPHYPSTLASDLPTALIQNRK